ncbi:hypothetical protein [Streptomyces parvulus]|uniref:hypothetical protein n=1 Tax=Streptomyces parvulus TaxID=146923 RepID=UPI0036AA7309
MPPWRATPRDDIPWVVTTSCPATPPAVQERHALAHHLRETPTRSRADADRALDLHDRLVEAGRRDAAFATAMRLVAEAGRPPGLECHWGEVDDESLRTFLKRKQDHDPAGDLRGLRCPHLALFGGEDPLAPVADSLRGLGASAAHGSRARRATLTVEVLPGADHRLRLPGAADPPPEYFVALTGWLHRRCPLSGTLDAHPAHPGRPGASCRVSGPDAGLVLPGPGALGTAWVTTTTRSR